MKKTLLISTLTLLLSFIALAQTTPVLFTMLSLTGQVNNREILVQPDRTQGTPLWFGTNLVPMFDFTLQPIGGQVTTNLMPWGYTIRVDGWPRSVHIQVPASTNTLNVVSLINTNQFAPIQLFFGGSAVLTAGTNILIVTNGDGSITISDTGGGSAAFGTATNLDGNATNQVNALALNVVQLFGPAAFPAGYVGPQYNDGVTMETPKWTNVVVGFPYTPGSEFNTVVPPPADIWLTYTNESGLVFLIPGYRTFGAALPPGP